MLRADNYNLNKSLAEDLAHGVKMNETGINFLTLIAVSLIAITFLMLFLTLVVLPLVLLKHDKKEKELKISKKQALKKVDIQNETESTLEEEARRDKSFALAQSDAPTTQASPVQDGAGANRPA